MHRIRRVALLVETSKSYGRGVLRGINQYVKMHDPWSMFLEPRALTSSPPSWLKSWKGDGIIARISDDQTARVIFNTNLPAVNLSSAIPNLSYPCIETDPEKLSSIALTHLKECGLRNFGFLGDNTNFRNWSKTVRIPFLKAVQSAGHECSVFELPETARPLSWEQEQTALGEWLHSLPKPVGVLAINDWRGQQLLDACKRAGLLVPDQIAVVGMENDELVCDMADPPLSSVVMSAEKSGYEAAALLERMMRSRTPWQEDPDIPRHVTIDPVGVAVRRSSDIQAHEDPVVGKAIRFIRENACRGIQVADVAKHANVSRSTLDRRMFAAIGRTPHEEITRLRIEHVLRLLIHTSLKVSAIASRTGFEHVEYMGVVFRKAVGMTPGEYRKQAQVKLSDDSKGRTVLS